MHALAFPIRYLRLQTVRGGKLWVRDLPASVVVGIILSLPYLFLSMSNYFHKDGFVDKVGTFSSVLTGFYIAGLLAVATFPRNEAGLDKPIEVGKIVLPRGDNGEDEYLTRREYVCAMFGYLAFISLLITVASIVLVTTSESLDSIHDLTFSIRGRDFVILKSHTRDTMLSISGIIIGHVFITTVRSLYYLIDRIYAVVPTPLPRDEAD